MAMKKKVKKRLIVLGSLLLTFITAVIIFLAITGIDIKTLIMSGKSTGSKVDTNFSGESISLETPTDGSKPSDYDALTNFAYFSYKLEHSDFEATTQGSANAKGMGDMGSQDVYDYRLKSGNYYYMDTRSTGKAVKVFQEQFFTPSKVLYRKSSSSSDYDKQDVGARSLSQEFSLYGNGPDKIIGYVVSSDTIKSQSEVIDNGDGTYTITLDLIPTKAPVYYQNKVKTNASSPDYPNFLSVSIEYTFDETWTVKQGHYMEVYSVHKGVWAETYTDLTETFTYLSNDEASNKISEKYNFYKNYFDIDVPSDDEINAVVESPLDYLATMANILNEDKLYAKVLLEVNEKDIEVKTAIDIKNKTIDATIGNTNIVFKDNKLYLMGNVKGYYDIDTLITMLNGKSDGINTNEFTLPFDTTTLIEGVMSDINNGSIRKSSGETFVDITFNLFGLSIPTTFTFNTKDENTVEFEKLDALYLYQGDTYKISVEFIDSYETTNTKYAIELAYAIDLNLNTTITYNTEIYNLDGTVYLDLKNKVVEGVVNLSNDSYNLDASIYYKDNYLYVIALDKVYAKISLDELKTLINGLNSNENIEAFNKTDVSYDLIKGYLENINISLDENLKFTYDGIIALGDIKLSNTSFKISTRGSYKDVLIPNKEYVDIYDVKDIVNNLINKVKEIKLANGISLNLDFIYKTYHVSGTINARFDNLSAKGILNIYSNDFNAYLVVTYLDDIIYLDYNNLHVKISKDKVLSTINEFIETSKNTNLDFTEILNILASITYNNSLNISLNTSKYINENLNVSFNDDLTISLCGENISGSIKDIVKFSDSITINSLDYTNLDSYIDNGIDLYNLIKTKIFNVNINELSLTYDNHDLLVNGDIYVNNKNVDSSISITIDSKYEIDAYIKVINKVLYVRVSNQTFKVDLNNLEQFINKALEKINSMLNTNYSFDFNNSLEVKQIVDVLNTLTIADDIRFDLESLIGKSLAIIIYLTTSNTKTDALIKTEGVILSSANITLTNSLDREIEVPTSNIIYENDILRLIDYVKSIKTLYDKKLFNLNINELIIQKSNGNYYSITGALKINFVNGLSDFDATANLIIVEYRNQSKYGWHQINLDIMSSLTTTTDRMVYATYGNDESNKDSVVKVYTTFTGVKNLINSITDLLKIETFKNLIEDDSAYLDINRLIESLLVNDDTLTLSINQKALNKNLVNDSLIKLALTKNSERLTNVEVSNVYLSYESDTNYTKISSIDIELNEIESLNVEAPFDMSGYIDITNMSYLFEALYNDAQLKYFEIKGTVVLNISLGSLTLKDVNVPVDIKIHVDDNGKPEIFATLSIPSVSVAIKLLTKKTLNIYYYDGYVYFNRIGNDNGTFGIGKDKDNYLLKITLDEFMKDPLTYLLGDYGMGLPSSIMNSITSADSNGDGFVNAADCVNSASIGTNKFSFNLDLGEIIDNKTIGDMDVSLTTTQIKNASGEEVFVLSTIEKFNLGFNLPVVNMTLSGSGLTLANIYDGKSNDLDMSDLYTFANNFNSNYELNTKYKNGSIEGTI